MTDTMKDTIVELLGQLGSSREAREYLNRFTRAKGARFAVVKIGGAVLRDRLDEVAGAVSFLYRLGLTPVLVHGAGPQLDAALVEAGVRSEKRDGLRVTSEAAMAVIRPVVYRENNRLLETLEARGVRVRGMPHGVFESRLADPDRLGLVGEIARVHAGPVTRAADGGAVPVVACLGESPAGQVMNVNADVATRELVWALQPRKVVFLSDTGGVLDGGGELISALTLHDDLPEVLKQPWLHSGMRLKLEQIRSLLLGLGPEASVSITSPAALTRELFTHSGCGTLIRRGERIDRFTALDADTEAALEGLIADSFRRTPRPGRLRTLPLRSVFVSESRRAAAVVVAGVDGAAYLDKFVVTPEARGEGLAGALWQALSEHHPALYWRARSNNPVNPWYFRHADFTHRRDGWVVFGRGMDRPALQRAAIEDAHRRDAGWVADDDGATILKREIGS